MASVGTAATEGKKAAGRSKPRVRVPPVGVDGDIVRAPLPASVGRGADDVVEQAREWAGCGRVDDAQPRAAHVLGCEGRAVAEGQALAQLEDQPVALLLEAPRLGQGGSDVRAGVEHGEALEDLRQDLGREPVGDGGRVPRQRRATRQHDIGVGRSRQGFLIRRRRDGPGREEADGGEEDHQQCRAQLRAPGPALRGFLRLVGWWHGRRHARTGRRWSRDGRRVG